MGFGDNIRRLREERGWTQGQLASRLGVTRTAVTSAFYLRPHESVDVEVADGLGALLCPDVSRDDGK